MVTTKPFLALTSVLMLLLSVSMPTSALNVLLTNDDGLTSNLKALYVALKKDGHDVIVSAPCQGQSGMGGAIKFLKPLTPLAQNCLNNAAAIGDPGAGPVTKKEEGFTYGDFYYVNGTPIMATAYGLDVVAPARWQAQPDLVISGPNEGRNAGPFINSSGTVSNVQFAAARGVPAIAVSAGMNTRGEEADNGDITQNPLSHVVAAQTARFVKLLDGGKASLPLSADTPLNINIPDEVTAQTPWQFTRVGSHTDFSIRFVEDLSTDPMAQALGRAQSYPGISISLDEKAPLDSQRSDEAYVSRKHISVSVMQVSFGTRAESPQWLMGILSGLEDE